MSLALDLCECKNGVVRTGVPGTYGTCLDDDIGDPVITGAAPPDIPEARPPEGDRASVGAVIRRCGQALRTASACGPFEPWTTSNSTR